MLSRLTRLAFRRGVIGGSRLWLGVGALALAGRLVVRLAQRNEEIVYHEELAPGDGLVISHLTSSAKME